MAIGVKVDIDGVRYKVSEEAFRNGQYALANQAHADMNPFVPKKEGVLRQQSFVKPDGSAIVYKAPYAAKQFFTQSFRHSTPGTGARWDLVAKSLFLKDWVKAFTKGAGIK